MDCSRTKVILVMMQDHVGMSKNPKDRVLIITDSGEFRDELAMILSNADLEPVAVDNGDSCLKTLAEAYPIVVIIDEDMGSGGWTIGAHIRDESEVPTIMIGNGNVDTAWMRVAAGDVDYFMRRPFGHHEIVARIRALSRRYETISKRKCQKMTLRVS